MPTAPNHPERAACLAISPVGTHIRPPPPSHVLDPFLTPDDLLFQTIHMGPAHVSASLYRLTIAGDVPHPQTLTLSALQSLATPTPTTVTTFHECFGPPTQPPTKNHWRVGNVRWTGVPLRELLRVAGLDIDVDHDAYTSSSSHKPSPTSVADESALFIHAYGLDCGSFASHTSPSYLKDLPLSVALDPRAGVTVAWALNGAPLSRERGWPVRLVVPGWFGTNAVKWLCRLEVRRGRVRGVWTDVLYLRRVGAGKGEEGGEREAEAEAEAEAEEGGKKGVMRPVWRVEVNSLITRPKDGEVLRMGVAGEEEMETEVPVEGWAWGWEDVAGVQVSADEGASWVECVVDERVEFSWQRFRTRVRLQRGSHSIMARARTGSGQVQALQGQRNHVHRVRTEVV